MRRPLLFLCVCLFVIIAIGMKIFSPPPLNGAYESLAGEEVFLSGQIYDKEYRENEGEEVLVLYLQSIQFSEEATASNQKTFQEKNLVSFNYSKRNFSFVSFEHSGEKGSGLKTNPFREKIRCEIKISELAGVINCSGNLSGAKERLEDLLMLGMKVKVKGVWKEFSKATNPGEFDLANYYGIEGICGNLKEAELLACGSKYWPVREGLYQLRRYLVQNLYSVFSPKEASILAKMLLGEGNGLDKEVRDLYQENGIVHILSISGLHISMLGMGLYQLLRKCHMPVKLAAVLGGVLIVLYGMLTGFGVSACRAIGMYLIHMFGEIWGKTYDMLTAMGVLCVTLLLENPRLVYHSGYLLSFSSVCGVGLLAPLLQKAGMVSVGSHEGEGLIRRRVYAGRGLLQVRSYAGKRLMQIRPYAGRRLMQIRPYDGKCLKWFKRRVIGLVGAFGVSLSVTLFTLPLQLFFFYKIPTYSVFLNLLVIPFVSVVMIIGFIVIVFPWFTFLCPVESLIFAWFEWLCRQFERLPGHTLLVGRPDMWKILVYYIVLLVLVCFGRYMRKKVVILVLAGLGLFMLLKADGTSRITFLDVGQGDCICVQTAEGQCFLFDCGSGNRSNVGENVVLPFLQYQGVDTVDGIFLSHPDSDHTNGVMSILEDGDICVKNIYLPNVEGAGEGFGSVLEELESMQEVSGSMQVEPGGMQGTLGVRGEFGNGLTAEQLCISYISAGMYLELPGIKITCLHPEPRFRGENNAYSACYYLEMEDVDILLTGDVEGAGEEALIQSLKKQGVSSVDILKVAHHGSRNSSSEEFLELACPRVAVISCGRNNWYGHPHEETLERLESVGSHVAITKERGAITLQLDGGIMKLKYFLK